MRAEAAKFVRALDRIATRALLILDQETLHYAVQALTIDGAIEFDEIPLNYLLGFLNVFYDGINIDNSPDPEIHQRRTPGSETSGLFRLRDVIDQQPNLPPNLPRARWSQAPNTEMHEVLDGTVVVSDLPIYLNAEYDSKTASIRIYKYQIELHEDSANPSTYYQISVVFR